MIERVAWVLALAAVLLACSDDETTTTTAGPATTSSSGTGGNAGSTSTGATGGNATGGNSTGGMGMGPGTITIVKQGLTGQDGNRLIASVLQSDVKLGGTCETINGGAASGVAGEVDDMNICMIGAAVVFDEGDYDIAAGIYPPVGQDPMLCAATQVTVAGNVQVTLPDFSTCTP